MEGLHQPPPDGDVNRGPQLLAVSMVTLLAAIAVVALRLYTRLKITLSLGWDDYTIVLALAIAIVGLCFNFVEVHNGYGRHVYYLSIDQAVTAVKYSELTQVQNIVSTYLMKLSICFFLLRIIERTHRVFARYIYALMVFLTLVTVALFIIFWVQCIPLQSLWDPRIKRRCLPGNTVVAIAYLQSAFGLVTDLVCALSPIYFIRNLQIARSQKIGLLLLIGLGVLTSVAASLKIVFLNQIVSIQDYTWVTVDVTLCALVEENVGIILATMPALNPLFKRTLEYTRGSRTGGSSRPSRRFFGQMNAYPSPKGTAMTDRSEDNVPLKDMTILKTTNFQQITAPKQNNPQARDKMEWDWSKKQGSERYR